VLSGHAGVKEMVVIGQPSARWGECGCAVIVRSALWLGDDAALVAELRALATTRLARFKQPKTYAGSSARPGFTAPAAPNTDFTSRNSSKPNAPHSRPSPDCL